MNELLTCALAWAGGVLLGAIFFGGLWWTVRKGVSSEHPVLFWFFGSMLLRMSIALVGFYFVSGGHWERLLMCLVGFVMARLLVTWLTRSSEENQAGPASQRPATKPAVAVVAGLASQRPATKPTVAAVAAVAGLCEAGLEPAREASHASHAP